MSSEELKNAVQTIKNAILQSQSPERENLIYYRKIAKLVKNRNFGELNSVS